MRFILCYFLFLCLLFGCQPSEPTAEQAEAYSLRADSLLATIPLYLGTYTRKEGHVDGQATGIYYGTLESSSGTIKISDTIGGIINPSFVALSHDRKLLYAVSETGSGELFAYRLGQEEKQPPSLLGQWPTGAGAPCHIAVDRSDRLVIVSNYMDGVVNVFYRNPLDSLIEIQRLQLDRDGDATASHAHSATFSPDNRFVFIADLGKDKIWAFRIDSSIFSTLHNPAKSPILIEETSLHWQHQGLEKAAGPRHFTFHPNGQSAYLVNELNASITAFSYQAAAGKLSAIQSITTLPDGFTDFNACADIHLHPNGRFLYASNRGHNSIVSYHIADNGQLSLLAHTPTGGAFPRNFAISPDGQHLLVANQNSNNILCFTIHPQKGTLDGKYDKPVKTPVCIAFF